MLAGRDNIKPSWATHSERLRYFQVPRSSGEAMRFHVRTDPKRQAINIMQGVKTFWHAVEFVNDGIVDLSNCEARCCDAKLALQ